MHSFFCKSVEINRQSRNQCFSLTRFHLGNYPIMQNNSPKKLDIVRYHIPDDLLSFYHTLHSPHPFGSLFYCRECFWHNIIKRRSIFYSCDKFRRFSLNLLVGKIIPLRIQIIDLLHKRKQFIYFFLVIVTRDTI